MLDMDKRTEPELLARIAELEAEVDRLQALVDGPAAPDLAATYVDTQEAIRAKGGEIGTITGPPIVGTTDSVNAGPARPRG
jgi:hypothetical protein